MNDDVKDFCADHPHLHPSRGLRKQMVVEVVSEGFGIERIPPEQNREENMTIVVR